MELKEFVQETLQQLIDGVESVTEFAREKGAVVNPCTLEFVSDSGQSDMWCELTGRISSKVSFDVAVTASEATEAGAKAGVFLAPFKLGAEGKRDWSSQNVSRISFALQVLLPTSELPKRPKQGKAR
jgi:hypothetical protein